VNTWVATLATTGVVLGAAYMLYLYRRVIFGRITRDDLKNILDMNPREIAVFAPLVILTVVMGVYPGPFLDIMEVSVANLVEQHKAAMAALKTVAVVGK
jgi:NADH-quinone oxidoreductase subunit M